MEVPEKYYQLFTRAGFVYDISETTWQMIKDELNTDAMFIEFEDIYGSPSEARPQCIEGVRHFSPEAAKLFEEAHKDDKEDYGQ